MVKTWITAALAASCIVGNVNANAVREAEEHLAKRDFDFFSWRPFWDPPSSSTSKTQAPKETKTSVAAPTTQAKKTHTSTSKASKATSKAPPAPSTTTPSPSQTTPSDLVLYRYQYTDVPYQVNPYQYERGPQFGYNQCNQTVKGSWTNCQTLIVNALDDFCLWGGSKSHTTVGDDEAAMVAYCTKDKHGSRPIAKNAFKGVQMLRTPQYIQITGTIDQTKLGLQKDDTGGELDPRGADMLGNPVGSLVYSNSLPGHEGDITQAINWNQFIGSDIFCIKLCISTEHYPTKDYCENRYDMVGCAYNMPASYSVGEFSDCESDLQDIVGVYTGKDGKVSTWTQPEGQIPATYKMPYTPKIPKSSKCTYYRSADLFDNEGPAKPISTQQGVMSAAHTTIISDGSIVHKSIASNAAQNKHKNKIADSLIGDDGSFFNPFPKNIQLPQLRVRKEKRSQRV